MARRSGLGKGLGALIPAEVALGGASIVREVLVDSVRPNPFQPRTHFDEESLVSLVASIEELGVLQPILVRELGDDIYELIAGERRWRAARRAGLQRIPVIVKNADDSNSLRQALVENLQRENLSPLEEAAAYQQLIEDFSLTHDEIATQVGKSRASVTNTLRLLQLPASVQRAVAQGLLTAGHARALLGTPDRSFQEALAKRAGIDGLPVRAVEEEVRAHNELLGGPRLDEDDASGDRREAGGEPTQRTTSRLRPAGFAELENLLSEMLNTRVKIEIRARKGRIAIEFATLEDLERIYKVLVGQQAESTLGSESGLV
ncbi:MAG: ParB/RepB/Spo0J family partition protein [Acidimicrobiales bacterium]